MSEKEYIKLKKTPILKKIKEALTPNSAMKELYQQSKLIILIVLLFTFIVMIFVKTSFGSFLGNIKLLINTIVISALIAMYIGEYYKNHKSFVLASLFGFPVFLGFLWPIFTGRLVGTSSTLTNLAVTVIFCGLALTLNLEAGFLGLPNFGKVAFIAVGAYSFAMANIALKNIIGNYTTVVLISILISIVITGLFGILLTLPTLRLREDYLAITTIVAGEILRLVLNNEEKLGGFLGFSVDNPVNVTFYNYENQFMYGKYINILHLFLILGALGISYLVYIRQSTKKIAHLPPDRQKIGAIAKATNVYFMISALLILLNYIKVFSEDPLLGLDIGLLIGAALLMFYRSYMSRYLDVNAGFALVGGFTLINFILGLIFGYGQSNIKFVPWYTLMMSIGATAIVYVIVDEVYNSPFGRTLRAIREDETSAVSVGKSVFKYRLNALIISSALSGLMGSVFAMFLVTITPQTFLPLLTFTLYIMMIIGGTANNKGVVYGALVVQILYAVTRSTIVYESKIVAALDLDPPNLGLIIVGVTLIFFLIYAPEGIFPENRYNNQKYYDMLYLNDEKDQEEDPLLAQLMKLTGGNLEREEWITNE